MSINIQRGHLFREEGDNNKKKGNNYRLILITQIKTNHIKSSINLLGILN